jgi:hypothetical protein
MQILLWPRRLLSVLLKSAFVYLFPAQNKSLSQCSVDKDFVRVLNPVDPWLDPARQNDREIQFIGKTESISVAMRSRCSDTLVLASFYGPRKDVGELRPSLFAFASLEVNKLGARLKDTDAQPPWPPEYNHAHHDIVSGRHLVASAMSRLSQFEPERILQYLDIPVLIEIARLMHRDDADNRFRKNAAYRFKRLFEDGGIWRDTWVEVAKAVPQIIYDDKVTSRFRSLWSSDRNEWRRIACELPQIASDPRFSSGMRK